MLQRHSAANAGEQAAGQGRRDPAAIGQLGGDVAARAFGDFARFVKEHAVKNAAVGGRGQRLVMGAAGGFKAHKFAVRLRQSCAGPLQGDVRWRGRAGKGLRLYLPIGVQLQAAAP